MAPRLSVSQITTLHSSFAEDLRDYVAAGLAGIGVWEMKLGERPRVRGRGADPPVGAPAAAPRRP